MSIFFDFISVPQKTTNNIRLSVIHNPSEIPSKDSLSISRAIHTALNVLPRGIAKNFITKLVKEEIVDDLKSGNKKLEDFAVNVGCLHVCLHRVALIAFRREWTLLLIHRL
jgi:hypothetical protein